MAAVRIIVIIIGPIRHGDGALDHAKEYPAEQPHQNDGQHAHVGLADHVAQIADVRGLGAMVAVEFNRPGTDQPDADFTKRVQAEALQRNLILLTCGVNGNVIRFLFPLTIAQAHFDEAMGILQASARAAAAA